MLIFKQWNRIIKFLTSSEGNLFQKTIRSGFWMFFLRIVDKFLYLVKIIIIARLLSPDDFGLFGIALLSTATLETFSQTGFRRALIQKKEDISSYLDTVWTIELIRGLLIAIILFFISPYIALFFETPAITQILRIIGLVFIINGLTNIAVIYFQKELDFQKFFKYQFTGTLIDAIVAIGAVFIFQSVWALVFGLLAGKIVKLIMSYKIDSYRPKLDFNILKAKELWNFGKWIFGSSILVFLITHGDDIFVGKVLGIAALGYYQMAYRISNMPATEITHVISKVTFPAYSKLQDNIAKLRECFLTILSVMAFLSFPIAGLIFILASDFTKIFLGNEWMPIVPIIQILVFWGLIRCFIGSMSSIFQSIKKPHIVTNLQGVQALVLLVIIYPLTIKWDMIGAALAVLLSAALIFFIRSNILIKTIECKTLQFYKILLLPLIITIISLLPVIFFQHSVLDSAKICYFTIQSIFFVIIYILLYYISDKFLGFGVWSVMKNKGNPFSKKNYE